MSNKARNMKAKDAEGDFVEFTSFMRRLVAVPHAEVQKRLEAEKREKKSKTSSRAAGA